MEIINTLKKIYHLLPTIYHKQDIRVKKVM